MWSKGPGIDSVEGFNFCYNRMYNLISSSDQRLFMSWWMYLMTCLTLKKTAKSDVLTMVKASKNINSRLLKLLPVVISTATTSVWQVPTVAKSVRHSTLDKKDIYLFHFLGYNTCLDILWFNTRTLILWIFHVHLFSKRGLTTLQCLTKPLFIYYFQDIM